MLSDQGSPYVGRFARGWRRLPERIPGQPQTRTRARSSIGTRARPGECPRGNQQVHRDGASFSQCLRSRGGGGARREDVVNQEHVRRNHDPLAGAKSSPHGRTAFRRVALGLRSGGDGSPKQAACRQIQCPGNADGQNPRLVEAALSEAAAGQGYPRDNVGRRGQVVERGDRARQSRPDPAPAGELEPVHRSARRSLEPEGCAGAVQNFGRTIATCRPRLGPRPPALLAPRRDERLELGTTVGAERPRTRATARTPLGEDRLQGPGKHRPTLPGAGDTTARAAVPG
jgi:hypothetical protein